MKKQALPPKSRLAKTTAIILAVVTVLGLLAVQLGTTLASRGDINVELECESGIGSAYTLEVGKAKAKTSINLFEAYSSNSDIAPVIYTPGTSLNNLRVEAVKAGVASIAYGTKDGVITHDTYQITDVRNISAYKIKDNAEVYLSGPDKYKASPVEVSAGDFSTITWRSMNDSVAEVNNTGKIFANGNGATIITGSFTDKWGVDRDLHLLVGVGVKLGESDLSRLLELIQKGEKILSEDYDRYTTDSLTALQDAVRDGKTVLNSYSPSEEDVQNAIDQLLDALNNLKKKSTRPDNIIEGDDGKLYRPVGDPDNVYEVVDEDGNSATEPPTYVYNPNGTPGDGENDRPAYPDNGFYYVEDPEGSNIYKKVNGDGTLQDSPAIWGGPDGKFGGGDDQKVWQFDDGSYWVHVKQNVWQKVTTPTTLGELTGGGPDENPVTTPATPVVEYDGKFYLGPLGPTEDPYYYGDSLTNSDNKLNSTPDEKHSTDDKFYLVDGHMVKNKPIVDGGANNGVDGRILDKAVAGDSADWIEIAQNGGYSLIVRSDFINYGSKHMGESDWQKTAFGSNSNYVGSNVQKYINDWFARTSAYGGDMLASDANLRNYTVKNTSATTLGTGSVTSGSGHTDGFSKPIVEPDRTGINVAFALSYGEASNYLSKGRMWGGGMNAESSALAKANYAKLKLYSTPSIIWLRSPGADTNLASSLAMVGTGRVFHEGVNFSGLLYPALWVDSAIFD
jgi:hypothetical protein